MNNTKENITIHMDLSKLTGCNRFLLFVFVFDYYYYYYYYLSPLCRIFTNMYLKQTMFRLEGIHSCRCSVFTVCVTCNVISPVKCVYYYYYYYYYYYTIWMSLVTGLLFLVFRLNQR